MSTNPVHAADEYVDLAAHFLARREIGSSLACSDEALRLGTAPVSVAYERWMCFMLRGEFERAWRETDRAEAARLRDPVAREQNERLPPHLRRVWDGTSLENRNALVRCYHGLGDTIQFIRFLPLLKQRARRVVLQCQRELIPLLASVPGKDAIFCLEDDVPLAHQCIEIELMELAYAFRTTLETIPNRLPSLQPPPSARASTLIPHKRDSRNVGLSWSSGDWDPQRNIPLHKLASLKGLPHLSLFSLQRGPAAADEIAANPELHITQTEESRGTIIDTAATICKLDLVISVDTMIAHLAGALGKPVWLLLPFCADWRWMLDGVDSPWYPTMRIFRQPRPGDWDSVACQIADAAQASDADQTPFRGVHRV